MQFTKIVIGALLLIAIGGISIGVLVLKHGSELIKAMRYIKTEYLIVAVLCVLIFHILDGLRLFVLSRALKIKITPGYGLVLSFMGAFGASVTPSQLGGEFITVWALKKKGNGLHKALGVISVKSIIGLFTLSIFLPFAILQAFQDPERAMMPIFIAFLALLLALVITRAMKDRRGKLKRLGKVIKAYLMILNLYIAKKRGYVAVAFVLSLFAYFFYLLAGAILILSFNTNADLIQAIRAQALIFFTLIISPTPGGAGMAEIGGMYVFGQFLAGSSLGAFIITWRVLTLYTSAIVGSIFVFYYLIKD
ncbi:MAG: flippase-like domain-containing protein [Aquificaceae bacterium]